MRRVLIPCVMLTWMCTVAIPLTQAQSSPQLGSAPAELLLAKVTVSNLERSLDFYIRIVGLKRAGAPPNAGPPTPSRPGFTEVPLNFTGSLKDPFFVLVREDGFTPTPASARLTIIGFKVTDSRATLERVRAAGFPVHREPWALAGGIYGMVRDPDGYVVELIESPATHPLPSP